MKVLITGANGFIGSHLTKELAKKHDVYCLVRASSNLHAIADENINIVFGDLHNKTSLRSVVKDVDYIFHLAGNKKAKNEKSYYDDNFIGTKNLLETIISERIKLKRFVFISSLSAYGPSNSLSPKVEDGIKEPVDAFGESKLQAQQYVQFCSPKVPSTIVVAPIIYGPGDLEMLTFFNILRTGLIPRLQGKEKYSSIIHVDDLVNGLILSAENKNAMGQVYFITNEKVVSWEAMAHLILDLLGKKGIQLNIPVTLVKGYQYIGSLYQKLLKKPESLSRRKINEMAYDFWICSSRKAQRELNWKTKVSLEDGLQETLTWYINEGLL